MAAKRVIGYIAFSPECDYCKIDGDHASILEPAGFEDSGRKVVEQFIEELEISHLLIVIHERANDTWRQE